MGCILSNNHAIDSLHFDDVKAGQIVDVVKLVRIDRTWIAVRKNGGIITNDHSLTKGAVLSSNSRWVSAVLKMLVKLKIIQQADMDEHMKVCLAKETKQLKEWGAAELQELAKKHGFKITQEQKEKLGIK